MVADPPEFTIPTSPNHAHRAIPHVDGAAWPCHLRAAPSRTSPGSAIKSQNSSFEEPAPRDRPLRREIISPRRAGKRRDGFTRRLLALHVAGLSSGRRLAFLPSLPPILPTRWPLKWMSFVDSERPRDMNHSRRMGTTNQEQSQGRQPSILDYHETEGRDSLTEQVA